MYVCQTARYDALVAPRPPRVTAIRAARRGGARSPALVAMVAARRRLLARPLLAAFLAAVLALASPAPISAAPPGSDRASGEGRGARASGRARPVPPRSRGGGLHPDPSVACSGCAATANQLMYLLDRPPKHRRREMVEEWSPTANANVTVPYPRSERFVRDALRRVCSRESLARFQRKETWLGETTWLPDDLPWDPARELARPIDEDLRRICRRALKVREDALLASVARRDPSAACRDLGCGDAPGALEALAEASWRLATDPWTLLKLAPVLLTAFAAPALLLPTFRPPTDQGDISKAVERVRAARRRGEGGGGEAGGEGSASAGARGRRDGGRRRRGGDEAKAKSKRG